MKITQKRSIFKWFISLKISLYSILLLTGLPASAIIIEAESGRLAGSAQNYNDGAASGGLGVAYLSNPNASVTVTAPNEAINAITIRYASELTGQISYRINGNDAGTISFNSTGSWVGQYQETQISVNMPANAELTVVFDSGDTAMNIDYFDFQVGGNTTPQPSPSAQPTPSVSPNPTPNPTIDPTPNPSTTPTPTSTPDPGTCGNPVDPAADLGEGYVYGMTSDGLVYHRAMPGHTPSFAILGLQSAGVSLPETGPYEFTDSSGDSYLRYEAQVNNVVAGQNYTLEIRLQGIGDSGQCIHSITVQPGQGETSSPCYQDDSGGAGSITPTKSSVDMVITDTSTLTARLTGGSGSATPGFALYTTTNACDSSQCLQNWPMLTVTDPEKLITTSGVTGTFGTLERLIETQDECGNAILTTYHQVTYNGEGLYFYSGDGNASATDGNSIPGWSLATAQLIEQMPLIDTPAPALSTPVLGLEPGSHGYVFDLDGSAITVRSGIGFQLLMHNTVYVDGVGDRLTGLGDREFEFWCSNNQIQWHKSDLKPIAYGHHEASVPGPCYGDYYYFFRFSKRGPVNGDIASRWTYSGLFTTAGSRVNPNNRPTTTSVSANWFRFRHPHAHDGRTEEIGNAVSNSSLLSGLKRFTMTATDSGSGMDIVAHGVSAIRYEALENGHQPNFVPVYNYNQPSCCGSAFDYGNVISFEITAVTGGIGSQTYTTHLHAIPGVGFDSPIGDPRLTLAGKASTNMVFSDAGSSVTGEKNAVFTQHLTTLTTEGQVDNFLNGFAELHQRSHGQDRCGRCHFLDGRGDLVVQTVNGARIPPPIFGVGLLEYIEGAEVGLTWDGNIPTVVEQVHNALRSDHGIEPSQVGSLTLIEDYTRFITVPNRKPAAHENTNVAEGHVLFHEVGCSDCHKENQRTSRSAPPEFRDLHISPFSDMKRHNIGTGGNFRTAPLWGLGTNIELLQRNGKGLLLLHDGRASSVEQAISLHAGEASSVMSRYNALSSQERSYIAEFLKTL